MCFQHFKVMINMVAISPAASDFIRDTVTVTIPAGTSAGAETVVMLPVVDDLVNEEDEEGFVALISVVSAVDPSLVVLRDSRSTVGRIIDNDSESLYTNN